MAPGAQPVTLEGQVCRIRSLSKRLTFMDLCCRDAPAAAATAATGSGGAAPDAAAGAAAAPTNALQQPQLQPRAAASERWVEVIAKVSEWEGAAAVRDGIRIGDIVRFSGEYQDAECTMLTCRGFEVLAPWRLAGGGRSFEPRVPLRAHAVGSHAKKQKLEQQAGGGGAAAGSEAAVGGDAAAAAASGGDGQLQLCKFYVNSGACLKGAACPFAHVAPAARGAVLTAWVKQRAAERRVRGEAEGCVHVAGATSKRHRARIFAQWLVDTYGAEALNAGGGVLDIAGGRGAVTFELVVHHGIKCTLVEPRPLKLDRMQHKLLKAERVAVDIVRLKPPAGAGGGGGTASGSSWQRPVGGGGEGEDEAWWREDEGLAEEQEEREADEQAAAEAVEAAAAAEAATSVEQRLPWLAAMRENAGGGSGGGGGGGDGGDGGSSGGRHQQQQQQQDSPNGQQQAAVAAAAAGGGEPQAPKRRVALTQVQGFFGEPLWSSDWWRGQGLHNPSLVIGQHPDEATELIVDYALSCNCPFAVMPCCVFPRKFPNRRRRLPGGGEAPVVVYAELVEFLQQKAAAAGAREAPLPFEGCNRVVWTPGGGGGGDV